MALRTVAEALTIAATGELDVDASELQAEYRPALTPAGNHGLEAEIYLYDTLAGGAGFTRRVHGYGIAIFEKALERLEHCPADCDASCYRCLRSFRNRFEHGLLDRKVGAALLRYVLDGTVPTLDDVRVSQSIDKLLADLQSRDIDGIEFFKNEPVTVEGLGTIGAPILARGQGRDRIFYIQSPLTRDQPPNGATLGGEGTRRCPRLSGRRHGGHAEPACRLPAGAAMADLTEPRVLETGVGSGRAVLPGPPTMWSYSSLKEVETCPLRYALSRADYPDLWEQHGYPRLPIPAAIRGDVVHGALEIIVKALARAGCSSARSAVAVAVMRELGGYTKVAEDVIAVQLARFEGNPRLGEDRREQLIRGLTEWVPEAREQIQTYLNRMDLRPPSAPRTVTRTSHPTTRYPARVGDHPEKELVAEELRLKGRIDLLSVDVDGVRITDFKTGAEDPAHHDQVRLYALLWATDSAVNPDGLPVTELVAAYPDHEVAVPVPSADDLVSLRDDVRARIVVADAAVTADPPVARLGEHCGLCSVRGLCDPYWAKGAARTAEVSDGAWYDLTGRVLREHGVKSFVLREGRTGSEVLVRTPTPAFTLPLGSDIRILGARRVLDPDEGGSLIAALTNNSEVVELKGR